MNWIAWDTRSYLGAALGGVAGFLAFGALYDAGYFLPWIVGLCVGLGCALVTKEISTMRGAMLAIGATWTAAAARTASTTLGKSTSSPSPISLTMRP